MRLWSLHPQNLDSKGLVALWREGLLAKHVLEGKTKGYKNHPQLQRFKASRDPIECINVYLHSVCDEAVRRGYRFDRTKLGPVSKRALRLPVTRGQMRYESQHLSKKLFKRDRVAFNLLKKIRTPKSHPLFQVTPGAIEPWEIV